MSLTKPELMTLVNNKIGPCLKMENLLSLLKVIILEGKATCQPFRRHLDSRFWRETDPWPETLN
jgi:hypothetical protein